MERPPSLTLRVTVRRFLPTLKLDNYHPPHDSQDAQAS